MFCELLILSSTYMPVEKVIFTPACTTKITCSSGISPILTSVLPIEITIIFWSPVTILDYASSKTNERRLFENMVSVTAVMLIPLEITRQYIIYFCMYFISLIFLLNIY